MTKVLLLCSITWIMACGTAQKPSISIESPSKVLSIDLFINKDGNPNYLVKHKGSIVIDTSSMGFDFKKQPSLISGLKIIGSNTIEVNEDWEMPWGENRSVKNHYKELVVNLLEENNSSRRLNMYFRAYDDGVGFRYEFPEQPNMDTLIILNENTEFNLTADHTVWWTPGDWDIYEHLYRTTRFSEIDALAERDKPLAQTYIPENAVNTPVTMRTKEGLHLSFHEANLTNYAGMTLKINEEKLSMTSELVGSDRLKHKVKRVLPFKTPWRTIQIVENAKDLIESNLIVNLNEPNRLGDVSWFKPTKYVGIWWELHLGKTTWSYKADNHGATTKNAKRYIDFAAQNDIKAVLIEGWNIGWEQLDGNVNREGVFDFITPCPDYNIKEIVKYGKERGVEIFMHHETAAAPRTYEQQMDTAFALMNSLGMNSSKTGYVGVIAPVGEYHHGQYMVNHFRKVIEKAAEYDIAINSHEPIKPTGVRRTFPNMISREGIRGQEHNAFAIDGGNTPEHLSIVAFTRMLAGPIDYTPGVFDIKLKEKENNQVNTTLTHQLALYVVIYSPIQMVCDLPENYEGHPAFQFIRDVGVDWKKTIVLDGEVGDFVTIARQEKGTNNWFVGCITDENSREIVIDFDFLESDKQYEAMFYQDGPNAHWDNNPTEFKIEKAIVTKNMEKAFVIAEGGGLAISFKIIQ